MFAKLIEALFKDRDGYIGRKLAAAWALTTLMSVLLIFHVPANALLANCDLSPLLNSGDFTATLSIIWATYFASNSANTWMFRSKDKGTEEEGE